MTLQIPAKTTPMMFSVERLTRLKQKVEGVFLPADLPELAQYLASNEGEIAYFVAGSLKNGRDGGQTKHVKCIIRGLVSLLDSSSEVPQSFEIDIESKLVLVSSEAELPPLELESEDEDYVVAGTEIDIRALVIEEVLLFLPPISTKQAPNLSSSKKMSQSSSVVMKSGENVLSDETKPSPFAKLAALKLVKSPPTKS